LGMGMGMGAGAGGVGSTLVLGGLLDGEKQEGYKTQTPP
jgi:hypothetical protein